jgi:hypothetical protein
MDNLIQRFKILPDWLITTSLFVLALATRIPFRSHYLYHWDSVNFALSLAHYDVRLHQPQPPGYFLYSMLGRLVNSFIKDANASLVLISLISGAVGVAVLYLLGKLLFNRQVGLLAALLTLTSPLPWFYSEVALSYALEFVCVIVVAGLCFMQWTGRSRLWPWTAVALGIAGGIRQNDLVFLFPLWLVSLVSLTWRQRIASLALLGGVVMMWFAPMVTFSGGISGYLSASRAESTGIVAESPIASITQLVMNGGRIAIYLEYSLLLGSIPLLGALIPMIRNYRGIIRDVRAWLFFFWIAPALGFYLFVHIRQHGHIFTFLPAVFLLVAWASLWATRLIGQKFSQPVGGILIGLILVTNVAFFLAAPQSLFGSSQLPLQTPSWATIYNRDQFLQERVYTIRAYFDPANTAILAGNNYFRHPDYYLPDFQLFSPVRNLSNEMITLPDSIHTLVLFDNEVFPPGMDLTGVQTLVLPDGSILSYIHWNEAQTVCLSKNTIELPCR